jgi:hypothetical protein
MKEEMKKAILVTCNGEKIVSYKIVEIPDNFVFGRDDQYGDKIPFVVGSNQYLDDIEDLSFYEEWGVCKNGRGSNGGEDCTA